MASMERWLGFEAYALKNRAGIGSYTEGLLGALLAAGKGREMTVFTASGPSSARFRGIPRSNEVREVRAPSWAFHRVFFEEAWLPGALRDTGAQVLFNPDFTMPLAYRGPAVVTVHDLSFWDVPESNSLNARILYGWKVPDALRRARRVVVDSDATGERIASRGYAREVPPVKVYPGVGADMRPLPGAGRLVKDRWGLDPGYVLGVGTVEPRKNWEAVGRAMSGVASGALKDRHFVLCGGRGRHGAAIQETLEQSLGARVHFLSSVDREGLRALYTASSLLVYPSLYEGFGLPVIEAMACGTPVVTSDVSSLPEAAGDAARIVDPRDPGVLGRAMAALVPGGRVRETYRRKGRRRARRFTWGSTARQIWEVLNIVREEHQTRRVR